MRQMDKLATVITVPFVVLQFTLSVLMAFIWCNLQRQMV